MNERPKLPDFPGSLFRSQTDPERIDRIWRRLAVELRVSHKRKTVGSSLWTLSAAACGLLVFGGGVLVGMHYNEPIVSNARMTAEPASQPAQSGQPSRPPVAAPSKPVRRPRSAGPGHATAPSRHTHLKESLPLVAPAEPPPAVAPPPAPAVAPAPDWQELAGQLEYEAARQALDRNGGFKSALSQASPEQLMILHDIARATGNRRAALQALQTVVQRYPDDPNAPIAAWSLGNLLEASGDRAGAAQAYSTYRSLSPQGDFADDALARQVQVAIEAGDLAQARRLATQYAQDFPNGRHGDELRMQLEELADAGAAAAAGAPTPETEGPAASAEESTAETSR
jgi:TolA-binding protein